eukprot:Phypoly_transcript_16079.p1 GENE.Phypoly_transcript_16079~~Phypoly_transcript_16079.p1  ORF type:complete len:116 (-),score=9.82 Phypoly_transcript_16079:59-406(-)
MCPVAPLALAFASITVWRATHLYHITHALHHATQEPAVRDPLNALHESASFYKDMVHIWLYLGQEKMQKYGPTQKYSKLFYLPRRSGISATILFSKGQTLHRSTYHISHKTVSLV